MPSLPIGISPLCLTIIAHTRSLLLIICAGLKGLNRTSCSSRATCSLTYWFAGLLLLLWWQQEFPCDIAQRQIIGPSAEMEKLQGKFRNNTQSQTTPLAHC